MASESNVNQSIAALDYVKLISISAELHLVDSPEGMLAHWPCHLAEIYTETKRKLLKLLGLCNFNSLSLSERNDLLLKIAKALYQTNVWVRMGFRSMGLDDEEVNCFPNSFGLDEFERVGLEEPYKEVFFVPYFLVAMIDIANFESQFLKAHGAEEDFKSEKDVVLLLKRAVDAMGYLSSAQNALEKGAVIMARSQEKEKHIEELNRITYEENERKKNLSKALPPRPISGIAKLFPLSKDIDESLKQWKKIASYASKPGNEKILEARTFKAAGTGKSKFCPVIVADWLVGTGQESREVVNRKLAANVEPGFEDMKEFFLT